MSGSDDVSVLVEYFLIIKLSLIPDVRLDADVEEVALDTENLENPENPESTTGSRRIVCTSSY